MDKTILHCDCNSFFASVETLLDPSLADGPTAVCGDPESRHGIILAKNEKAKAFGVQTAETIWQAKRKCPDLRAGSTASERIRRSFRANATSCTYSTPILSIRSALTNPSLMSPARCTCSAPASISRTSCAAACARRSD